MVTTQDGLFVKRSKKMNYRAAIFLVTLSLIHLPSLAQTRHLSCFQTAIQAPSPFMGNHDEIFQTTDGSVWKVQGSFEFLFEFFPTVTICPDRNVLLLKGKRINVIPIASGALNSAPVAPHNRVIFKRSGCRDYFLADGDGGGIYLLEWYGGYDPSQGDIILGEIRGYGFKDVFYPERNSSGRVYVDDYLLSRDSAARKIAEKCR